MAQMMMSNIMIVDDDPDILSQVVKIFTKLNIENVKTFTVGEKAIQELENSSLNYDVIFIDVKMPGMSGVGLLQHIKNHKNKKIKESYCIPIVGNVSKEETIILNEIHCTETITKPIVESVFLKKFKEIVDIHNDPNSDKNFQLAFSNALLDKKYSQAESLVLPRIKKEPNSVRYLVMYAELLMKAKQWPKAEEFLNKVLKIDSNYIPALNLISKIYIKAERFEDAMAVLEKAKNLSPLHIDRLLVIGEMNLGAGNAALAEENFRNALKINPIEEKASFGLGRALATQGKVEESKKVLSAIQKGAELASFFNNKGVLLVRAQKISEGISLYQNAIKVMDEKEREYLLLYNIALAYSKLGNIDSALEFAKKSNEKAPKGYTKVNQLIEKLEKLQKEKSVSQPSVKEAPFEVTPPPPKVEEKADYILTGNQMDFIMGGFEEPKQEELKTEEEFITFGL